MTDAGAYAYRVFNGDASAWDRLVADALDLNLMQTWAYGAAKAATGPWRAERGVVVDGDQVVGAVQTMIRETPVPGTGMAWINRGPMSLDAATDTPALLRAVALEFADRRGLYLRLVPMVAAGALNGAETGLSVTAEPGWASARVDLTRSEADLRGNLNGKWRNALVGAERADIDIAHGTDPDLFDAFLQGHAAHLGRHGAQAGIDTAVIRALQAELPAGRKLSCLIARHGTQDLGGVAIVTYGRTGEYFAGHNTDAGRAANAGQLLLWTAMLNLKSAGHTCFDLGGMDERLTPPGIFRFKQRVGGQPYRLANTMEAGTGRWINRLIRWRAQRSLPAPPEEKNR